MPTGAIRGHDKLLSVQVAKDPIAELDEAALTKLFWKIGRATLFSDRAVVAPADSVKAKPFEAGSVPDLVTQFGLAESYVRKILPIGFLAPDLMAQILDGRQPARLQIGRICDGKLPLDWARQRQLFANLQR